MTPKRRRELTTGSSERRLRSPARSVREVDLRRSHGQDRQQKGRRGTERLGGCRRVVPLDGPGENGALGDPGAFVDSAVGVDECRETRGRGLDQPPAGFDRPQL